MSNGTVLPELSKLMNQVFGTPSESKKTTTTKKEKAMTTATKKATAKKAAPAKKVVAKKTAPAKKVVAKKTAPVKVTPKATEELFTVTLPPAFYDYRLEFYGTCGKEIKRTPRTVVLRLTESQVKDYYRDAMDADAIDGTKWEEGAADAQRIRLSAQATVRAFEKQCDFLTPSTPIGKEVQAVADKVLSNSQKKVFKKVWTDAKLISYATEGPSMTNGREQFEFLVEWTEDDKDNTRSFDICADTQRQAYRRLDEYVTRLVDDIPSGWTCTVIPNTNRPKAKANVKAPKAKRTPKEKAPAMNPKGAAYLLEAAQELGEVFAAVEKANFFLNEAIKNGELNGQQVKAVEGLIKGNNLGADRMKARCEKATKMANK